MSTTLLTFLLTLITFLQVGCELPAPNLSDSYSNVYPFLEKWANTSYTRMLTVVFDDYKPEEAFYIPRGLFHSYNVSTKLVTLKHLMSLKNMHSDRDYQAIEAGGCVLLLYSDVDHLRDTLSSPHLISFWQPENVYILQDRGKLSFDSFDGERFCKWAFEKLWKFRRVYKLMLFAGGKAIRYDPFRYAGSHVQYLYNSSCDWLCVRANKDNFLMVNQPNETDISDFFEENERRSFDRHPLKISIFKTSTMTLQNGQYGGLDYKYLEEVCRMMNVTPILTTAKDRHGWEDNGVFYGTLGDLVYEFTDVSFNQFFVKDYLSRQIEFTAAITSDKLCVMVPKAPPVPDYLVIVKTFSGGAWMLILTSHFVIAMIYTTLKGKLREEDEKTPWVLDEVRENIRQWFCAAHSDDPCSLVNQNCIKLDVTPKLAAKKQCGRTDGYLFQYVLWSKQQLVNGIVPPKERYSKRFKRIFLFCLMSLGKYLTRVVLQLVQPFERSQPWFPERLFLMCSLCLSLILNGVFTSQLASTFSKRMYYDDIDTLEQLEESGLTILTNSRDIIDDALTDSTSPLIKRLHMRMQYANDSEIHRRLFVTKDAGFLHRLSTLPLKYDDHQIQKLHIVKECPKDYILANVITKGSPFHGRINNILGKLNNGGFYDKWYQGMYRSKKRIYHDKESTTHRRITMRHLVIPFAILHAGLAASAIVFIYECRQSNV
ncbi:uncharacterized protein LOC143179552 [Calliopsis andreniformis]|uniref:uncharacterized protein LOC143179552 n=1 Tax=Calliopsis andreniformis TaxID=337506 RepID=UPI003FCCDFF4